MNYNLRKFKSISVSEGGEVSSEVLFHYYQKNNILQCNYSGGAIQYGHLIGIVDESGRIDMRYHQINSSGKLTAGRCTSIPEINKDGKIVLHESWEWTYGNVGKGTSTLKEL